MLAGECPLYSAWGRFEDGAPAPHEHLAGMRQAALPHTLAGECPPLRRWGALRTEPPLHVSACAVNDEL